MLYHSLSFDNEFYFQSINENLLFKTSRWTKKSFFNPSNDRNQPSIALFYLNWNPILPEATERRKDK